jgi:hypothetical protein
MSSRFVNALWLDKSQAGSYLGQMDRKAFVRLMAAGGASFLGLASSAAAPAVSHGPPIPWGRLKFRALGSDDNWNVHPQGDVNLIDHMIHQAPLRLDRQWNVADIATIDDMARFPFLFMHAESPPELEDQERQNLREYFLRGGFLFAEDCVIGKGTQGHRKNNDKFFRRMQEELPRILPEAKFERLPKDHPVYHCLFHLPNGLPHCQGAEEGGWGLTYQDRLVAFLSPSDTHCGWTEANWFPRGMGKLALQMGTNLYVYAMTQPGGGPPA